MLVLRPAAPGIENFRAVVTVDGVSCQLCKVPVFLPLPELLLVLAPAPAAGGLIIVTGPAFECAWFDFWDFGIFELIVGWFDIRMVGILKLIVDPKDLDRQRPHRRRVLRDRLAPPR